MKKIIEIFPLFAAFIIITGVLQEYVYYSYFNVPISYFISLSEIGVIISSDLLFIVPTSVFIIYTILTRANRSIPLSKFGKLSYKLDKIWEKIVFGVVVAAVLFYYAYQPSSFRFMIAVLYFLSIMIMFSFVFFRSRISAIIGYLGITLKEYYILVGMILVTSSVGIKANDDIRFVLNHKYLGTKIVTKDTTYISDSTSFFIGKTDKFLFFYSMKDSSTTILPTESIIKIFLKTKHYEKLIDLPNIWKKD